MKRRAALWLLLPLATCAASVLAADISVVPNELWDRPRSGRAVLDSPGIRQAVQLLLARPDASLIIHHGRGQERLLEAEELRAWLIALSVEATRILLNNDLQANEPLKVEIRQ